MSNLSAHLAVAAGARFSPLRHNCFLFAADWVFAATGSDPAAGCRDRAVTLALYRDADRRTLAEGAMGRAGFARTGAPRRGDVGLLDLPDGPTAGICLGPLWAVLGPVGLAVGRWPVLVAWDVVGEMV